MFLEVSNTDIKVSDFGRFQAVELSPILFRLGRVDEGHGAEAG